VTKGSFGFQCVDNQGIKIQSSLNNRFRFFHPRCKSLPFGTSVVEEVYDQIRETDCFLQVKPCFPFLRHPVSFYQHAHIVAFLFFACLINIFAVGILKKMEHLIVEIEVVGSLGSFSCFLIFVKACFGLRFSLGLWLLCV